MPGNQAVADLGGHGRQLDHGLGDPATRIGQDLPAHTRQLLLRCIGPEHDAVPAGTLDRLDHEFLDPVEDLFALLVQPAPQRVDVGQQRLLAQVVLDDRGHIGIDEFVVAHPVADGAGDHHVAGPGGVEHAGDSEHRIGPEMHGVEEFVVDTPVDHVDLPLTLGGAHVDDVVAAEQVRTLDQFHAHLTRQQ